MDDPEKKEQNISILKPINLETQDKDALGHDFASEYTTDKEPTCTQEGSKSQHCSRCSATQNVTVIPATGSGSDSGSCFLGASPPQENSIRAHTATDSIDTNFFIIVHLVILYRCRTVC
mgnify:CR=1 FL=1